MELLYHYYDHVIGPFRNLSDLPPEEADQVLKEIRRQNKGFAGQRSQDYLAIRRTLENQARQAFLAKGGNPVRQHPHYMTLGECPWLLDWYTVGASLQIPLTAFEPDTLSFTYGDLFPTMRYQDGKPYRGQVYTLDEIFGIIRQYGWPQDWNTRGDHGPERYIEVQVWDERPLVPWILPYKNFS